MPPEPAPPPSLPPDAARVRRRVTGLVFVTVFLDLIGFGLIIPLLPFYVESMGGTATTVGVLLALFSLAQLLATPVLGRLSDRVGRRPIILFSLVGNALSMALFALATHVHLLPLLFASRLLAGATAGNLATCQAAIADVTEGHARAEGMGRVGAGIGLGMVLGPVLGSQARALGPWAPPLAAALLATLAVVGVFFLFPETLPPARRSSGHAATRARAGLGAALRHPGVRAVLLLVFLTFVGMTNLQVSLGLLAQERFGWGEREVGMLFGLQGGMAFVLQGFLIGRLTRAVRSTTLVLWGSSLMGAGLACIALAGRPGLLALGMVLMGGGTGLLQPVVSSLASRLAPPHLQGGVLGVVQSAGGLARVAGPVWSGFLYTQVGPTAPFASGVAASLLALLVGVGLRGQVQEARAAAAPAGEAAQAPAPPAATGTGGHRATRQGD